LPALHQNTQRIVSTLENDVNCTLKANTEWLEGIVWRLNALHAQVNLRLSTVMRRVRKITPKPFETGQMAGGGPTTVFMRSGLIEARFITERKGVVQKFDSRCLFDVYVPLSLANSAILGGSVGRVMPLAWAHP
jgi:hypothetical protein